MASSDSLKVVPIVTERGVGDIVAARYRLVRKVGSGGMGSVWYAQDLSLDAPCAVKLIDGEKANDEGIRMRFEREAKASAQLRSAHVVNVFDYGEWNRTQYLAMEYLDGEDLAARLMRLGCLDFETTYRIIAHVARALMAAHALGVVHRDLKPENIFLVQSYEEEIAKVLDFGIAQHNAYSIEDRATREGAFLGTPCYVSPEQARGRQIDHRSDLWSLGVIAFQCLTGQLPFEGRALGELMGQILYEPLPIPSVVNPELPGEFDEWWQRAASRDREERFQSAKEMADRLGVVLGIKTAVMVPSMPPRRRTSIPPEEYSGVITATRLPEAAIRTTAAAPEAETGPNAILSPVGLELPLTRDEEPQQASEAHGEIDHYIAQLAAQPLVPLAPRKPVAGSTPSYAPKIAPLPALVSPTSEASAHPRNAAPAQSQAIGLLRPPPLPSQPPARRQDEPLVPPPRAKQASEVRFISPDAQVAPVALLDPPLTTVAHSLPAGILRTADRWRSRLGRLSANHRRAALAIPIAGALVIVCAVLWLTFRTHGESVSSPGTQLQSSIKRSSASIGVESRPTPRPSTTTEPLTVDMLPLISGKTRSAKPISEAPNRTPQSQGAPAEQKQGPKGSRSGLPDYGI